MFDFKSNNVISSTIASQMHNIFLPKSRFSQKILKVVVGFDQMAAEYNTQGFQQPGTRIKKHRKKNFCATFFKVDQNFLSNMKFCVYIELNALFRVSK